LNAEGEVLHESGEKRTSETVAGFLAAIAIFVSLVGLAWHPLRLILPSLAIAAVLISGVCLFFGLTIAVAFSKPLW
jgi:hypothetical protein